MGFCDLKPIDEDSLRAASAFILGEKKLDEDRFKKEIDIVVVFDDRLEFNFKDGRRLEWQRE